LFDVGWRRIASVQTDDSLWKVTELAPSGLITLNGVVESALNVEGAFRGWWFLQKRFSRIIICGKGGRLRRWSVRKVGDRYT
jgi:hypothetical protein